MLPLTKTKTGAGDKDVPIDRVLAFHRKMELAGGASVSLITCDEDADHYSPVNSESREWPRILHEIEVAVTQKC